ncbi:DUF6192 family protein [Streptomyces silvisoli]|uniref:DUF6192 family protein n=1 Tax=Streptomyces silvisoli TaxID=3034235 RepID=A0ABT5ZP45_9ACTN|nr:DUF6192 family protein [Streptomyces silvisoli]MDF3291599.1 DUF6192 family protein [Streptomyces silvisoli]
MSRETEKVGAVSPSRYGEIVAELRQVVEQQAQGQFTIGDRALEIEPIRLPDDLAALPGGGLFTVRQSLTRLAEDIGLRRSTVENARWTASRWPKEHRRAGVSFTVHRVLGSIPDEEERFAAIKTPPEGKSRWTIDDANRRVRRQEFTRDESVATTAVTGPLRRPDVAFKAMSDDTARFQVNHAQNERSRQARGHFDRTSPVAPTVRHIDRTVEFLDLVTACHSFVAAAGRATPRMRDRTLDEDQRTIVHENVARVRATLDWIETAVDTGKVDMNDELARLLKGE